MAEASVVPVCVVGLGPIGTLHASIYASQPDARLVGVCDLIRERAERAGKRFGVPFYTSVPAMLAAQKPQLVSVATGGYEYSSDHKEPVLQALRAGCHVLCEKPISNSIPDAEEMVAEAKKLRRCLAVDFNHRFTPAARQAEAWLREGRLGPLIFCNMGLWIGKPKDEASPYFHLKALNPHSVDMMRHYCGDIRKVQLFAMKSPGRSMWSTASFNMQFASGAVGHLTSSYDIARGHPMERCEVAGTKGRMVVDDMWREATLYPAGEPVKSVYTNPVFGGYSNFDDTFRARISSFVTEVAAGADPERIDGSGADGLAAQRVIAAGIESLETGRIVEVPAT
jgi:predicted dehydrogenase